MTQTPEARPRRSRLPFVITLVAVLVAAASMYLYVKTTTALKARPKVAIVTWNENPFWDPIIRGAQDAAGHVNAELTVVRSKPDVAAQNQHVRDLLAKGIDGIAISPNNPAAQAAVLDEAAAKTVLITFDSDAPNSKRRLFIGTDDYAAGQLAGQEVREAVPDGGAVVIVMSNMDQANVRNRRQGLIDDLLDRPLDRKRPADPVDAALKGERYAVAATVVDGADAAKSAALLADALKAHPEARCVVGLNSYTAAAAVSAVAGAGRSGQVKIIGFDEAVETQAGVEAGTVHASILQDQYRCGYEVVRVLADAARGVDRSDPIHLGTRVLRKANLDDLRATGRIRQPGAKGPA